MSHEDQMRDVLKAVAVLLARLEQGEAQLHVAVDRQLRAVHGEVARIQQRIDGIVSTAQARITDEARVALGPVTAEYGRVMDTASARLHMAGRTVWTWYAGLAGLGLLLAVIAWGVLGYYQRELGQARAELARYENAIPVVRAFSASDAIVCGDRICVNVDPGAPRRGDRQQYLPARPSAGQ